MKRVVLISPDKIRDAMAGTGDRFLEMARHLSQNFEVMLLAPNEIRDGLGVNEIRSYMNRSFHELCRDADAVVIHGHISRRYFEEAPPIPTVVDLYDPFLVENMHYTTLLGRGVYERDSSILSEQLRRGDFFLCSTPRQRLFYLGMLMAAGRVNPELLQSDPSLNRLIAEVPPALAKNALENHKEKPPSIDNLKPGDRILFFGGIYDWYDPFVAIRALETIETDGLFDEPLKIVFCSNPNREITPQVQFDSVRNYCMEKEWLGNKAFFIDWLPYDQLISFLHQCDLAIIATPAGLEAELSFRTRLLEYLYVGLPVITTRGDWLTDKLEEAKAISVVEPGDHKSMATSIVDLLRQPEKREAQSGAGKTVADEFTWDRVIAPLAEFCESPTFDEAKPETLAAKPASWFDRLIRRKR